MDLIVAAVQGGLASLASYLAAHVLLCLVPAFFVAGALSALLPQESITRFLGPQAPKWVSYPAAAGAGSLLAVCSCTVQPLFAGIYRKGAGLGPAITFLFFAPAANILALSYTGVALGADFAVARIVLALSFGIGIGLIMGLIFHRDDAARPDLPLPAGGDGRVPVRTWLFLGTLVALLIAGTLKVDLLRVALFGLELPAPWAGAVEATLLHWVPVDAATGAEGLSLHGLLLIGLLLIGLLLIGLLAAIGGTAYRGLGKVDEGYNRLSFATLLLTALTLVVAALGVEVVDGGLKVVATGRSLAVALLCGLLWPLARRFESWDMQQWLWETWRFVRQIFPLLVVGVFAVGVIRIFIEPAWIQAVAGSNTLLANLAGVVFGVFMYFPTLVEVPIAKMFLSLGMHPGPLIAYLMADPELSLQSILITSAIIGKLKAWTYVGLVALASTLAGLAYGAWIDGMSPWKLLVALGMFVATLVALLGWLGRRKLVAR